MSFFSKKINILERELQHSFHDIGLLIQALTHKSASRRNNERLEFLGDTILQQVISEKLYNLYPESNEGMLSSIRSLLVCKGKLSKIAKKLKLKEYIYFGRGEIEKNGGENNAILTGVLESIIAAVYLDSSYEICKKLVLNLYVQDLFPNFLSVKKNPKSFLQELFQGYAKPIPEYISIPVFIQNKGKMFITILCSRGIPYIVKSTGKNIRSAQQVSAKRTLEIVNAKN